MGPGKFLVVGRENSLGPRKIRKKAPGKAKHKVERVESSMSFISLGAQMCW